jgi:hypothetical protein
MSHRPIFLRRRVHWVVRDYWLMMLAAAAIGVFLMLSGCVPGMERPETLKQQIAYVEGGLTAAYTTIGDLKVRGRIDAVKRDKLVEQADTVGAALDASRAALTTGDTSTAIGKLETARAALLALEGVLKEAQ